MSSVVDTWRAGLALQWALRNPLNVEALDEVYRNRHRVTRTEITRELFRDIPRDAKVLEVGAAAGVQLDVLKSLGFTNLTASDLEPTVLSINPDHRKVCAEALHLPFRDGAYDLVFTSGVLIHIPLEGLGLVLREITRVSRRWVAGFEPYSYKRSGYIWPGHITYTWLDWYCEYYRESCEDLRTVCDSVLTAVEGSSAMGVFLLEKASSESPH